MTYRSGKIQTDSNSLSEIRLNREKKEKRGKESESENMLLKVACKLVTYQLALLASKTWG